MMTKGETEERVNMAHPPVPEFLAQTPFTMTDMTDRVSESIDGHRSPEKAHHITRMGTNKHATFISTLSESCPGKCNCSIPLLVYCQWSFCFKGTLSPLLITYSQCGWLWVLYGYREQQGLLDGPGKLKTEINRELM